MIIVKELLLWNQSVVLMIDRHERSKILIDLIDRSRHLIVFLIRRFTAHVGINPHGSRKSLALIYIQRYQNRFALAYLMRLLTERKKKILLQSHVEKGSDFGDLLYRKHRCLSYRKLRDPCRCNQAVLRVFINKYADFIARLRSLRNLFLRKQNGSF